jgi:FlaA1/EpsC-like NDP-sugar epimerase
MLVGDLVTLGAAFVAAFGLRGGWDSYSRMLPFHHYVWILWVIAPIWIGTLRWFGAYESATYRSSSRLTTAIVKAHVTVGLALLSVMYLAMRMDVSRLLLQTFLAVSFVLLVAVKLAVRPYRQPYPSPAIRPEMESFGGWRSAPCQCVPQPCSGAPPLGYRCSGPGRPEGFERIGQWSS